MSQSNTNNQPANSPVYRVKVANVIIAIWETMGKFGPMHGFTATKRYRRLPQPGDTQLPGTDGLVWAASTNMDADDLLALPLAAQRARGCLVDPRLYVGLHLAAARP